jgi:hypothetical protein
MFLHGVDRVAKTRLLKVLGYKEGNFPVRYPCVPFMAKAGLG